MAGRALAPFARFLRPTPLGVLLGVALVLGVQGAARAQRVPTCVHVELHGEREDGPDREALAALVESELDRHPTHVHASADCDSELYVERIVAGARRYLTGRINWQVPHRVPIEDGELVSAISELLRVVLHNDPIRLRGPDEGSGLSEVARRLKEDAPTLWGLEVFELVGIVDGGVHAVPGLALRVRRELARWHVGVRLAIATRTSPRPDDLALQLAGNLSLELAWFSSADARTAAYVSGLVGLEYQWFHGPLRDEPNRFDDAHSTGVAAGVRGGVETMRFSRTRMDLWVQVSLPLFVSRDEGELVMRSWFPTMSAGVGVAF